MSSKIKSFKSDKQISFENENIALAQMTQDDAPISYTVNDRTYLIALDGIIYNIEKIKEEISDFFDTKNNSDIEILLKAYIHFGPDLTKKLNGIFSFVIWDDSKKRLFMARDHFGIKPMYYSFVNNMLIFSPKLACILEHPLISPHIEKEGLCELFGIGPAHTPGTTVFKNIEELKPANFLIFDKNGIYIKEYWKLESKAHTETLEETAESIRTLLKDAIELECKSKKPICTFLSGGLDSSVISLYTSKYLEKNNKKLDTFSVDYLDNDKNFVKNDFQPNTDNHFIEIMKKELDTNHKNIVIDTPELANALKEAMLARDFPGMADIDSSLLLFCNAVRPYASVSLTGECSDEIFGGYPWFFKDNILEKNTFPWSFAISERQQLLNPVIGQKINLKDYIDYRYNESLSQVDILPTDSAETAEKRKISHLTLNWFMQTLLDRSERMATFTDFEIRVPFCDYRLVQYAWNIPWDMKALNGREKGILRYAMKGILPDEIVDRKKSPYPKTFNPTYLAQVKKMLTEILGNKNSPINYLINLDFVNNIIKTDGKDFKNPWFGQLMTGPQFMAYLIQLNMWLEEYRPTINF